MSRPRALAPKEPAGLEKEFDYLTNACSAGDCTGLIPVMPKDQAQLDSYEALYAYRPPVPKDIVAHRDDNQFRNAE